MTELAKQLIEQLKAAQDAAYGTDKEDDWSFGEILWSGGDKLMAKTTGAKVEVVVDELSRDGEDSFHQAVFSFEKDGQKVFLGFQGYYESYNGTDWSYAEWRESSPSKPQSTY